MGEVGSGSLFLLVPRHRTDTVNTRHRAGHRTVPVTVPVRRWYAGHRAGTATATANTRKLGEPVGSGSWFLLVVLLDLLSVDRSLP